MKFVDEVKITIASGHGGAGSVSFRRESMTPRGGPDGGDGGRGGNVIFKTSRHINSLVDIKPYKKYAAPDGQSGASDNCYGSQGEDLRMIVPEETIIHNEAGEVMYDLGKNQEITILQGGRGGKGNTFFKNSVNQAPEHAQPGEDGVEGWKTLELKGVSSEISEAPCRAVSLAGWSSGPPRPGC